MQLRCGMERAAAVLLMAVLGAAGTERMSAAAGLPGVPGVAEAHPRTVLVELFTSEGCSSCPPADALLGKINGRETGSGELVVGLSEHVTYWNQLGWTDPFSQALFTARQSAYGARFRLDSVYTPQMVVNGTAQVVGSDARALLEALGKQRESDVGLRIDAMGADAEKAGTVTFSVMGAVPRGGLDIYAVVAEDMQRSSVARGENAGRRLAHVAVARTMMRVATMKEAGSKTVSIGVPGWLSGQAHGGRHLVLFAQEAGLGPVVAVESRALGGDLASGGGAVGVAAERQPGVTAR